jgi:phosphopantothenoylcysteine decarboxylase/phosphopantothenate--cysteine ligase
VAEHKLKKDTGGIPPIELLENPDILAEVAALKNGPFCVGFAAESRNLDEYAQAKRRKKNIPLIAGNLIQDGFGGDDNRLVLFDDNGTHPLAPAPKSVLARQLVAHIADLTGKD